MAESYESANAIQGSADSATSNKSLRSAFLYEQESLTELLYKYIEEDDSETNENAFRDDDSEGFLEWLDSFDEGAQENILNVMDS